MTTTRTVTLPEILSSRRHNVRRQGGDLFAAPEMRHLPTYECTWFGETTAELPHLIVPVNDDLETLFADVTTFYPNSAPITAFAHVLSKKIADDIRAMTFADHLSSVTNFRGRSRNIWIALMIAEALSAAYGAGGDENEISYSICRRTQSFALGRYSALYGSKNSEAIAEKWASLNGLGNTETSVAARVTAQAIRKIASAISGRMVTSEQDRGAGSLIELLFSRYISHEVADALKNFYPEIGEVAQGLYQHFDARVPAFERVSAVISQSGRNNELDALALGFYANLIAPGTFAHTRLLSRRLSTYPTVILWYGVFAALSEEFEAEAAFQGLGSKLIRDLEASFRISDRPSVDISIQELEILSRAGLRARVVKPLHPRALVVSLFPGVDMFMRFTEAHEQPDREIDGSLERDARDRQISSLLSEIQRLLAAGRVQTASVWPTPPSRRIRRVRRPTS